MFLTSAASAQRFLGEGQVHADDHGLGLAGQPRHFLVEFTGLQVADGRVEGRHGNEDEALFRKIGQAGRGQFVGQGREGRGRVADADRFADQGQALAHKGDDTRTFRHVDSS